MQLLEVIAHRERPSASDGSQLRAAVKHASLDVILRLLRLQRGASRARLFALAEDCGKLDPVIDQVLPWPPSAKAARSPKTGGLFDRGLAQCRKQHASPG